MKSLQKSLIRIAGLAIVVAGLGSSQAADGIRIVAARKGSAWHAFAASLARQLKAELPDANVSVISRGNGYWNPIFVNSLRAEFGLSNVASASWAYRGNKIAYKKKKYNNLRAVLGGIRPVWLTAMLHEDYIRRTGFFALDQALTAAQGGPRIVMKPAASTVPIIVDMILAAMGSSRQVLRERGGDVIQVGAKQIPAMIRDGRADLYFEATVADHPSVLETALTGNVRFVDLPEKALTQLQKSGHTPKPLPRWFKGQDGPVNAVDMGTMVIVHRDVANEVVYAMVRALVDRRQALAESHSAFRDYDPSGKWSVKRSGVPLHPGAAKFFRERGWSKLPKKAAP